MLRSATSRLILAHLILFLVSTAAVLGLVTSRTLGLLEAETRNVLAAELDGLAQAHASGGLFGLARAINRRLDRGDGEDRLYLLTDGLGRVLTGNLAAWPPTVTAGGDVAELELFLLDRDKPSRMAVIGVEVPGGARLLVGREAGTRRALAGLLIEASIWAVVLALALSLATGWLLTRLVSRRLGEIRRTAGEIMSGDLTRRMPSRRRGDEFDRLAETLNGMLDRIETLVSRLRTVTESLAHDLRSPLGRLSAALDEIAAAPTPQDRARLIAGATAEADAILKTFSALIEISRVEAGVGRDAFERVDLGTLATSAAELYEPVAADREISLAVVPSGPGGRTEISGHGQLLAQALSNLLENSLRHAPSGSEIRILWGRCGGEAELAVLDRGPGIPPKDRARVRERFVTLDPSRGQQTGLGLALVDAVARLHGGRLDLGDAGPGLAARLVLPVTAKTDLSPQIPG